MTNAPVLRASDFLGTIGVNTHVPYTDGGYANVDIIAADLAYLNITEVRDGITNAVGGSAPLASYIQLASQGVKFTIDVVDATVTDTASLNAKLALVQQLLASVPGSVVAVEGANEINNWPVTFNGVDGLQGALDLQAAIYAAVHGNPALAGVAVDYFTGYGAGSVATGPNPSTTPGLADNDTQHPYPNLGQAPETWVDPSYAVGNESAGQTGPLVYTETGYSSNGGTSGAVDTTVQAKYTLDLLFDAMKDGVSQTDLYQLLDAYAPGSPQGDDGFGLFNTDNSPKPVATAIHNLTTILADKGASAATFQTGPFAPTLTGPPATGNDLVLEKSSGVFDLVVWAEPTIWNEATGTEVAAATQTVTIGLGATYSTVSVYDPLAGSTPLATLTNVNSLQIGLTDHPLILEVGPPVPQPTVAITAQVLAQDTGASSADKVTSNGAVTLSGTFTGAPGTSVQVVDGTATLGTAVLGSAGDWTFTTTLGAGAHALHAVATDPTGNAATTAAAPTITVLTAPPTIAVTAATVLPDATSETLTGTVAGAAGTTVAIFNGVSLLGAASLDGKGGWTYSTSLAPGTATLTAVASDPAGNATSARASLTVPAPVPAPLPAPLPAAAAPDTLVLSLSEDAYKGNAQFTVSVDGTTIGGPQSVTALRSLGQSQTIVLTGAFGSGPHTVGINFLNDLYEGTPTADRNLYVHSITLDGKTTQIDAAQMSQGLATYGVTAPAAAAAPSAGLSFKLSEDAYQGDARFTVSVDGQQVGGVQTVTALRSLGQTETFAVAGEFNAGQHKIGINFLNDLYAGASTTDRNLYVSSVTMNGMTSAVSAAQMSQGLAAYTVKAAAANPSSAAPAVGIDDGATLILDSDAAGGDAVAFNGTTGTLQLTDPQNFHGQITGFGAGRALDLRSVGFAGSTTLGYSGAVTGGTLTVSDGAHTASLALAGNFTASHLHLASDGFGGSLVTVG